jgi:hypothetical protein
LETIIRKLRIQTYKGQLAVCNLVCTALSKELENVTPADDQWVGLGHRLDEAVKESYVLQLMLDLMEKQEREEQVYY